VRGMKSPKVTRVAFILLALPVVLYGCVVVVHGLGGSGSRSSPAIANFYLAKYCQLPDTASDVYCYTDWAAAEAEFAIAESDFLKLCKANGWQPDPIGEPIKYFYPVWGPKEDSRLVHHGYYCYAAGGDLVFDAERSRAAWHASEFP
jgi:hypothetical protein